METVIACLLGALVCGVFLLHVVSRWIVGLMSQRALMLRADLAWASSALGAFWAQRRARVGDHDGAAEARAWGAIRAAWLLGSGCVGSWPVGDECRHYPRWQPRGQGDCVAPVHLASPTRADFRSFAVSQIDVDDGDVQRVARQAVQNAMAGLFLEHSGIAAPQILAARLGLPVADVRRAMRRLDRARVFHVAPIMSTTIHPIPGISRVPSYQGPTTAGPEERAPAILDPELAAPPSSKVPATVREAEPHEVDEQAETRALQRPPFGTATLASVGMAGSTGREGAS
jgi:hypothetical protein